ncbi:MAG: hypothetical protein AAF423_07485 [Pseudomonadota bacterium]
MYAVADTEKLVTDSIISHEQAKEIELRAREAMVTLAINSVLFFGILSATGGLVFWLASPLSVAIFGILFLGSGLALLAYGKELFRMFGNAAALIGAGMMIGGGGLELVDKYFNSASYIMVFAGGIIAIIAGYRYKSGALTARFVTGAIMLMGVALHLFGVYLFMKQYSLTGLPVSLAHLYTAAVIGLVGWFVNVRIVTALAIVPFAQALDTGTQYFHAAYVFYSPESTLSILQMTLLIASMLWLSKRTSERSARHARVTSVMALIVANLCALVGSLWGDRIGETIWGPGNRYWRSGYENHDAWKSAHDLFLETAWIIPGHVYSILWAVALLLLVAFAAHRNNRGLFNTSMTFAGIHAYTQMFESFADEPLAWVIGGLAAIPLAWGMWRLNTWFTNRIAVTENANNENSGMP